VPLIIIVVSYSLIGLSLRKQIVSRAKLRRDSSGICKSTQNKFLKATIAIIATFAFTWLPYQVDILQIKKVSGPKRGALVIYQRVTPSALSSDAPRWYILM
jgi:hypothetical protein